MFSKKILFIANYQPGSGAAAARAQDNGALLDLLVRKGLITDQERDVRADLVKERPPLSR